MWPSVWSVRVKDHDPARSKPSGNDEERDGNCENRIHADKEYDSAEQQASYPANYLHEA